MRGPVPCQDFWKGARWPVWVESRAGAAIGPVCIALTSRKRTRPEARRSPPGAHHARESLHGTRRTASRSFLHSDHALHVSRIDVQSVALG